jgi:hypothetical protein
MPTLNVSCSDITLTETKTAINKLKHGKAAGDDEIPEEMLKATDDNTLKYLLSLYNNIWQSETPPSQLINGFVVKLSTTTKSN